MGTERSDVIERSVAGNNQPGTSVRLDVVVEETLPSGSMQVNGSSAVVSVVGAHRMRATDCGNGDRGAVLVEFALTMPLLVMLLLGMFTGGLTLNQKLAIANGVREGSRYGATLPVAASCSGGAGTLSCWLTQVADLTQTAAEGNLASSAANLQICVAYVSPAATATDKTTSLTRTSSGDTTASAQCFDDGRPASERRVQVTATRDAKIEYLLGTATPTLTSRSITKFEAT
jgi:Flp pilus assembly protein TadG